MFDNYGQYIGPSNDKYVVLAFDNKKKVWYVSNHLPYSGANEKLREMSLDGRYSNLTLTKVVRATVLNA